MITVYGFENKFCTFPGGERSGGLVACAVIDLTKE
jgi:hypothetical protein